MYYGSYVGDGTRGLSESNPMSITFPFEPKRIYMFGYSEPNSANNRKNIILHYTTLDTSNVCYDIVLTTISTVFSAADGALHASSSVTAWHKLSEDRRTYYWYTNASTADVAFNSDKHRYHYIAYG